MALVVSIPFANLIRIITGNSLNFPVVEKQRVSTSSPERFVQIGNVPVMPPKPKLRTENTIIASMNISLLL